MQDNTAIGTDPKAVPAADTNGTSREQTKTGGKQDAQQRAEEMVDRLGEQIGHYVSVFGHKVLKWIARAREEAEDIWAEAQAIRERQRNQKS
jgi:hypothetical protein